jgi:outer membrane receptor protein involved in Fe transport
VPGYLFNVMRPINGDKAKVHGIEVGLQHLWDNGFGVRAQYTRNHATSWVGGERRPLEGVAPATSSAGLLYEQGPWSLSVDADHTDGFTTAVNVLGAGYDERVPAGQLGQRQRLVRDQRCLARHARGRNLADATERYTIAGNRCCRKATTATARAFTIGASYKF